MVGSCVEMSAKSTCMGLVTDTKKKKKKTKENIYKEHSKNRSPADPWSSVCKCEFFRNQGNAYHIYTDTSVSIALCEFPLIRVAGRGKKEKENFRSNIKQCNRRKCLRSFICPCICNCSSLLVDRHVMSMYFKLQLTSLRIKL